MQRALVEERRAGRVPDLLLVLEHPHVITLGARLEAARLHLIATPEMLAARNVEVHESGRGGDITYHGPGQVVVYPVVDLRPDRCDVHRYVRDLEEVMIRAAGDFGVKAARIEGLSGAWVGADKLGAVGVRISRWITSHGFAFNVMTDLDFFNLIVPCGITSGGVTSLARATGRPIQMADAAASLVRHFGDVFGCEPVDAVGSRVRWMARSMKMIHRPTVLTLVGVATVIAAISGTTGYVLGRAPSSNHVGRSLTAGRRPFRAAFVSDRSCRCGFS
jgi:lipoyl(octanoyl) transferase